MTLIFVIAQNIQLMNHALPESYVFINLDLILKGCQVKIRYLFGH